MSKASDFAERNKAVADSTPEKFEAHRFTAEISSDGALRMRSPKLRPEHVKDFIGWLHKMFDD